MKLDARSARCTVFVYREGLLAAVGHDLKLAVTEFTVDVDWTKKTVQAQFDARSIKVQCAMVDGRERSGEPGEVDRRKIEGNIARDVLQADRYPTISFESTRVQSSTDGYSVEGRLSLHGTEKSIAFVAKVHDQRATVRIGLEQTDFGIRPFSAMMGALRIKPRVDIELDVPMT
jgi:polyisoprenoid-binding protein YceI